MAESEDRKLYAKFIARKKAREAAAHAASPIPDGVTDHIDFSGKTSAALPLATTDFGDVIPAPAPVESRTKEATPQTKSFPKTTESAPDTYGDNDPEEITFEELSKIGDPYSLYRRERQAGIKKLNDHFGIQQEPVPERTPFEMLLNGDAESFERARKDYTYWLTEEGGERRAQQEKLDFFANDPRGRRFIENHKNATEAREAIARNNEKSKAASDQYDRDYRAFQKEWGWTGEQLPVPSGLADFATADRILRRTIYLSETFSKIEQALSSHQTTDNRKSAWDQILHGAKPRTVEDFVSLGIWETFDLSRLASINEKASKKEPLTDGEKAVAEAFLIGLNAEAGLQLLGGATDWEKAGQAIGDNASFLVETALTGGLGSAATTAVKGLARKGLIKIAKKAAGRHAEKLLADKTLKFAGKAATSIIGTTAGGLATAPISNITYRNLAEQDLDQYDVRTDEAGNYIAEKNRPVSFGKRLYKSTMYSAAERGSEYLGDGIGRASLDKLLPQSLRTTMSKTRVGHAVEWLRRHVGDTPAGRRFDNYMGDMFKWYGIPVEILTEEYNNLVGPLLAGDFERLKESFSPEAQWDLILSVSSMGAAFGSARVPFAAFDHARHARTGAKLRSQISDPTLSESLQQIMASGTRQEQAQKLGQIDWSAVSMQDRAAAMDYVAHQVEGRVTQDMQEAMREQAAAAEAQRRFEQRKNRDTGNLETVTDLEGNSFYLAGGTLEAGENGTADGTVFVIDPKTGETSQRSVEELKRGETTTPEQYETEFRQQLETISQAEAEAAAVEEIVEEAVAAGEDPTPRVAAYKGIDLNALAGETVTLADGSQSYINQVYTNRNGAVEIDAVPIDPSTGQLLTDEKGEEAHTLLDVRSIVTPKQQQQAQTQGNTQEATPAVPEQSPTQETQVTEQPAPSETELSVAEQSAQTELAETAQTQSSPTALERPTSQIGRSLTADEAGALIQTMQAQAIPAPELELTPENWTAEFGENGEVETPVGTVKMGENQLAKMFMKGRSAQLGMVKPTLTTPDAIVEVESEASNGQTERPSSLLFIKTFLDKSGEKHTYFTSVTVQRDGMEVTISNHIEGEKRIRKFLEKGKLLYRVYGGAQTEQNRASVSGTTPPVNPGDLNKGTTSVPNVQETEQNIPRKKDGTKDYAAMEPNAMFQAIAADFGEEVAHEEIAKQIGIYEKKIAKLTRSQSEDLNRRLTDRKQIAELQTRIDTLRDAAGIAEAEPSETGGETTAAATAPRTTLRRQSQALGDYLSLEDKILRDIAEGLKFRWTDEGSRRGLATELGFADSPAERRARFNLLAGNGTTVDRYAEHLAYEMDRGTVPMEWDADVRGSILDVLTRIRSNREAFEAAKALRDADPRLEISDEEARRQVEYDAARRASSATRADEVGPTSFPQPANDEIDTVPFLRSRTDEATPAPNFSTTHRAQVEEIVRELDRASGARAVVFSTLDELPEDLQRAIQRDPEFGNFFVQGISWKGVPYLCAPFITDLNQVETVYHHETAGHCAIDAAMSASDRNALCEAIVDDIGVEHMRSLGIQELNEEIQAYEEGEISKRQLGREYIAYSTERFFSPALYNNATEPVFSVDLSQPVTDATIKHIIESANRKQNGKPNLAIRNVSGRVQQKNPGTGVGVQTPIHLGRRERGGGSTDLRRAEHRGRGELSAEEGESGTVPGRGVETGDPEYSRAVPGQDDSGADRAEPGALPAGETVAESSESDDIRYRQGWTDNSEENEKEFRSIIESAQADGTYLKAPNGKLTRLSERQWAQVRTQAFKNWFGDWEKTARIEKLRRSEPLVFSGDEYKGKYELNPKSVTRYILDNLRGEYVNKDTGNVIRVSRKGAEKAMKHDVENDVHLKSAAYIPQLIENAVFITEEDNTKSKTGFDSYRYYVVGLNMGGADYTVKLAIGVKDGQTYYDHSLTQIEKNSLIESIDPINTGFANNEAIIKEGFTPTGDAPVPSYALSEIKDKRLLRLLQTDSSRIVDENGEPLVVYHGTDTRFTRFDPKEMREREGSFFFAENRKDAEGYSDGTIMPVFVNVRNPFDYENGTVPNEYQARWKKIQNKREQVEILKVLGFDGWTADFEQGNGWGEVSAFHPAQIKSATDNTGAFSAENDDIRFRNREAENTARLSPEEVNERFNEQLETLTSENADSTILWLGNPSEALQSAGVRNLPLKLYGNKLLKKIAKHGYQITEIKSLPQAVAHPIAIFEGSTPGSHAILTELETGNGKNVLVSLSIGKGNDVDFNVISSVYGKNEAGIPSWINNGKLRWADKQKALDHLRISAPIAEALNNQGQNTEKAEEQTVQELSSATNIIKNFANPTLREGEKASAAQILADELGVPVRVVRSTDEIEESERDARRKRGSTGWHDRATGEIAVVLANCADAAEVQRTILHEAVGHYGLPELLGRERADELYRRVFDVQDKQEQEKRLKIRKEEIREDLQKAGRSLTEEQIETLARTIEGDEYLAEMAEGNVTPGVFRRMLAAVRAFFRNTLGIDLKLTDADLRYLLWRSRHNLERARTVSEAMEVIEQDIRLRAQTAHESARERKAERLDKLRRSEPIRITGKEIAPGEDLKQYKKNALEYGKTLRGEYVNRDTGERIMLHGGSNNGGIREILQHDYKDTEHLQSIAAIPQIIEQSVFIDSSVNLDQQAHPNVSEYRYYVSGLDIGGTDYTVKSVVAVDNNGNRYYDHKLTSIEKGKLLELVTRITNPRPSTTISQDIAGSPVIQKTGPETTLSAIKDKRLISVLQAEPLAYQQEAAKSAPKTVMEHLDRLADEATETDKADEIRFRKKREPGPDDPIRTTKENLATRMGRKLQDAHIPVRQLQDYVRKHGGTTDIDTDVYSALNRAFGRQTERMRRTDEKFRRIERRMSEIRRKWGFKYKATEEYLAAKSSQERHAWGIAAYAETTEAPWNRLHVEETIARFESVVPKEKIEALWRDIREMTQHQLDVMKNCDLITVQTYRDIQARGWQYYLPLQGLDFEFEDMADPHKLFDDALTTGRGTGAGALLRKARGRTTKPGDVLATLQRNVHLTIMAGEQNLAKQFLLRLAEQNPQLQGDTRTGKGIFEIEEQWFVRRDDSRITDAERERGEIYEKTLRRPPKEEIERSEAARREMKQAEQELRAVEKKLRSIDPLDGDNDRLAELQDRRIELERRMDEAFDRITVLRTPPPKHAYTGLSKSEEARFEVPVYRHGVRTVVRLSDANAARAINGDFENLFGGAAEEIVSRIGRATRMMAGLNTSWNPEFMLKNKVRDSAWALFYNWLDKEGSARGYLRNQGPAHAAIYRYHTNGARPLTMNERAGYDLYSAEGRQQAVERYGAARVRDSLYDDFLMEGGLTGYAYMQDLDHYSRRLKKRARRAGNSVLKAFNVAATGFDLLNDLSEVSTRFATFLAQVERGSDVRSAVNYARDVTINFNRRGEWGRDLNALYMFYNASLQGVANLYQLGRRNKTRMGFAMAAVAGLGYGLSFLLNLWLAAMADEAGDDDEWRVSDYRRFTNICLPGWLVGSTERVVGIPLPQELRPAWVLGTVMADVTQGRLRADEGWGTAAAIFNSVADAAGESFLPVEVDLKHPLKTFVPSVFKPLYEIYVNEDFMNKKIYREAYPGQTIPQSQLGMRNTFIAYKTSCEWLNEQAGGSTTVPAGMNEKGEINRWLNLLDVNPSKAEHLFSSYGGGVGRLIVRTWRCIAEPGDERRASDIPFINAFMADVEREENPNTRYYDTKEKLEMLNEVYRRSEREGSFPAYYRSVEEAQAARARDKHWLLELRKTDGRIKKLTQERNETEPGSPEHKTLTREMNRLRSDFLTRYDLGAPESPTQEAE